MAIQFIVRLILKMTPTKLDDAANILAAHEEIRGTIELKTIGGAVAKRDAAMLGGVLDLKDLQVPTSWSTARRCRPSTSTIRRRRWSTRC